MQNRRSFVHLDHERRAATSEIIRCADTREDAIDRTNAQTFGRHEAADVSENRDQGSLSHIGGLAAHVWAGDDQQSLRRVKRDIVCDEWRFDHLFDDEMPAAFDLDARRVCDLGLAESETFRAFCQAGQYIDLRESCRCKLQFTEYVVQLV